MELVVHGLGEVGVLVQVSDGETPRHLFERLIQQGYEVDLSVAIIAVRDSEDDLQESVVLVQVLEEGAHVHLRHGDRHCERVDLHVRFGKDTKRHPVRPNSTVGRSLEWAAAEFGIIPPQRAQYRLKLPMATGYLDNDTLIGELVTSPPCELQVDLVRFEQNAGAEGDTVDEEAVKRDLQGVGFRKGVINGRWRNARIIGKHVFVEMVTPDKSGTIELRLDITGYPAIPPQGVFWDRERNTRLADEFWPTLPDGNQAFRKDWAGGLGLYIACDRSALVQGAGHPEWANSLTNTNWRPKLGIVRYLSVVADLLAMATIPGRAA